MKRDLTLFLLRWLHSSTRKPLILRGARQVGKTWLIRDLAASEQRQLIELNFEKRPDFKSFFSSNDPQEILKNIRAFTGMGIEPSRSFLFLDEIQTAPQLLEKLRWFAEDMPELPVVAAGSLLDFALAQHEFTMPVGRVGYLYLEPFSFEEFLDAAGQSALRTYLQSYTWDVKIPEALHVLLTQQVKEYLIVGGMPAAVSNWASEKAPEILNQLHFDLLGTYRDDFTKYNGRLAIERLEEVMSSVPRQLGNRFVYKEANPEISSAPIKQALNLLTKARICHRVEATAANGLPLGAEVDDRFPKVLLLDCGLCSTALGLSLHHLTTVAEFSLINRGAIAEQLVGQLLRTLSPPYIPPSLYYWRREQGAEVDYVMQHEDQVIPIEVKAGTTGTLRSLHQFMKEKKKKVAVRINSALPNKGPVQLQDSSGDSIEYTLLSLPFYLLGQLHRLIQISK